MLLYFRTYTWCSTYVLQKTHKISKQDHGKSVQELTARAVGLAKTEAAKNISAPNSAYQFEVFWRGLSGDRNLQTHLLKVLTFSRHLLFSFSSIDQIYVKTVKRLLSFLHLFQ